MKNSKNKKLIYWMTSGVAAVFILGVVIIGTNTLNISIDKDTIANKNYTENDKELKVEVALVINKLDSIGGIKFDADEKTITLEEIPKKYSFITDAKVPKEYKLDKPSILYTRENKNGTYNILHDYVFNYIKDDNHSIRIALSEVGEPIRDYHAEGEKISKIGNVEVIICQYEDLYIATFKDKQINFDIETVGISETELKELLISIIK